jgi:hypothetical protein
MPVIRIDDDVMNELKKRAVELGLVFEPPNSTLRKILDLDKQLLSEEEKTEILAKAFGDDNLSEETDLDESSEQQGSVVETTQQMNWQCPRLTQVAINTRSPIKRLLSPGVKARYIQGGNIVFSDSTPTGLAQKLKIRPAKYVLGGHPWDNTTFGTEGYRTTVHSFTANGYEVDIGDGWGQYTKEETKPYSKFDARKKAQK